MLVDLGSTPVRARTFAGVTATGVLAGQQVIASVSADMPDGLAVDELEMDPIAVSARVTGAGVVQIVVTTPGLVTGRRRINLIAA